MKRRSPNYRPYGSESTLRFWADTVYRLSVRLSVTNVLWLNNAR